MLFNEPKLLKYITAIVVIMVLLCFSALQRAEIAEIIWYDPAATGCVTVSVLFNEPKLLKCVHKPAYANVQQ